ncbi:MAG: NAD-binding protein [Campylobacteraceae bacterium]|jgi:voltage-gated potassium channel|nr:NAD-binding protein [Campylobacteraceae bacterium]
MNFDKKDKSPRGWHKQPATPKVRIDNQIYEQLKPLRLPLILLIVITMIGAFGYVLIDNFTLIDAIYQAGFTFTTVGFGEIGKISTAGRFFTIGLIVLGFGVFSFSIGILIDMINKGTLIKLIKERRMLQKIARLKNHFVICHHNNFTVELSKQFRQNHIPFVVVDNSPDIESIARQNLYPYFVQGEPHTELSVLKSSLSSAKGVITLSENIADNIAQVVTTRLYEKELGLKKPFFIMSHASNDSDALKLKKLGADSVVSPSKLVAQRLSVVSLHPDMQNMLESFLSKKDSPINIEEVEIPDYSWLIFKKLKEARIRDITNVSVVGISDLNGKFLPMPQGETLIGTKSKLLLIGSMEGIINTKRLIRKKTKPEELKYV